MRAVGLHSVWLRRVGMRQVYFERIRDLLHPQTPRTDGDGLGGTKGASFCDEEGGLQLLSQAMQTRGLCAEPSSAHTLMQLCRADGGKMILVDSAR